MARDYKNSRRKPEKKPVPGWVWMLAGLMVGLLVALLVYLSQQPGRSVNHNQAVSIPASTKVDVKKEKEKEQSKKQPEKNNGGLRYEFYTVLPESEVVIPEQELIQRERDSPAAQREKHTYILQAGSFRKVQEAETLKARLALLGVESSVEKVVVNGDTWHRIRIGPFVSIRDINSTRNRLRHDDINSILIRTK